MERVAAMLIQRVGQHRRARASGAGVAVVVLLVIGAGCGDDKDDAAATSTDSDLVAVELFGVVDESGVIAAHAAGSADFPLWSVDLAAGSTDPMLHDDADFVLSAAIDTEGRLALLDGSTPTRLLVAEPSEGLPTEAAEIASYDLTGESGITWLDEDEIVFAGARAGEETDLYLVDLATGETTNLTETPGVFESSPAVLDAEQGPIIAYVAAPVVGTSDVPEYGPTEISFLELRGRNTTTLSGDDVGLSVDQLDGSTLEVIRACPDSRCLVASAFDESREARSIWCVSDETRTLDLEPGRYRSPVVLPDHRVAALVGEGTVEVTEATCD